MKDTERKMAAELMELSLEVIDKTEAHVSFDVSDYGPFICIGVMEKGFRKGGTYEGWFMISHAVDELTEKMQSEDYEKAKRYLEGLLQKAEEAAGAA